MPSNSPAARIHGVTLTPGETMMVVNILSWIEEHHAEFKVANLRPEELALRDKCREALNG